MTKPQREVIRDLPRDEVGDKTNEALMAWLDRWFMIQLFTDPLGWHQANARIRTQIEDPIHRVGGAVEGRLMRLFGRPWYRSAFRG